MQTATIIALAILAMTALAPAVRADDGGVADGDTFHSPGGDSIDCLEFGTSPGPNDGLVNATVTEQDGTSHGPTLCASGEGEGTIAELGPVTVAGGHLVQVTGGEAQYHHADWDPGVWKPMVSGSVDDCDEDDDEEEEEPEGGKVPKGGAPTGGGPITPGGPAGDTGHGEGIGSLPQGTGYGDAGQGEAIGSLPQGVTSDRRGLHARSRS